MKAHGFALLGVIAMREADGALATLGEPSITESAQFKDILRNLADEIEIGEGRSADLTVPLV